jgi:hypothetical protein
VLPVDATTTLEALLSLATVTPRAIPLSLKLPVGLAPSNLIYSPSPRLDLTRGVPPSPSDTPDLSGSMEA